MNINKEYSIFIDLFIVIGIVLVTVVAERVYRKILANYLAKAYALLNADPTNFNFLKNLSSAFIYCFGAAAAIYTIPPLRTLSTSLLAGAGVIAAIIGFASQQAFSNIISGVFIVIFKPFRVNDFVEFDRFSGTVEDITLRHTVLRNLENRRIVVPNAVMNAVTIISTQQKEEKIRRFIHLTISHKADIELAIQILKEEAEKHPLSLDTRTDEEIAQGLPWVDIRVMSITESGVVLRAGVWAANASNAFALGTELNRTLAKRYHEANIQFGLPLVNRA